MKKILVATSEAGTANILVRVAQIIAKRDHFKLDILINNNAERIFDAEKVLYTRPQCCDIGEVTVDSLTKYLENQRFDCIITGIMGDKQKGLDFNLIKAAQRTRTKTIAFLDSWCNYGQRLESIDGADKCAYLPDVLVLMNRYAYKKLKKEQPAIPGNRLKIIGHLHYHYLLKKSCAVSMQKRKYSNCRILFLSQPIQELYGAVNSKGYIGYTQYEIIEYIIKSLEGFTAPYELVIRIHPRDSYERYNRFVGKNIRIDRDSLIEDLIKGADIVLGMSTSLLIDSVLYNKYTGIAQIGLKDECDMSILSESGFMQSILNKNVLSEFLRSYVNNEKSDIYCRQLRNKLIEWLELDNDPEEKVLSLLQSVTSFSNERVKI